MGGGGGVYLNENIVLSEVKLTSTFNVRDVNLLVMPLPKWMQSGGITSSVRERTNIMMRSKMENVRRL